MKIIVGLGNPGSEYNFTRHNAGFLALDYYFQRYELSWESTKSYGAIIGTLDNICCGGSSESGKILFMKPQNYYNESGQAVAAAARYYKVNTSDILAICDNFDLEFGKIRFRASGSTGGNNGLKSIDACLNTSDYPRVRIGTGNDELRRKVGNMKFVLSRFTPEEREKLPDILEEVRIKIDEFIRR